MAVGGATSKPLPVQYGVPQGSIIGPLLFLVAINDLNSHGQALLFADDTTLITSGPRIDQALLEAEASLAVAAQWFQNNGLQLNPNKTQRLVCSLSSAAPKDEEVKLLGFVLDRKFSWNQHVQQVVCRLSRVSYLLIKLRNILTEPYLTTVYHALFHCHISYGLRLWGHSADVSQVLKMQKRALRIITFGGCRDHCRLLFVRLGILTVFSHYILVCLRHVKENLHSYNQRADVHGYNTRHRGLLDVPRVRLARTQRESSSAAVSLFNRLPASMRTADSKVFVAKLTSFLKRRAYYSLSEFLEDDLRELA